MNKNKFYSLITTVAIDKNNSNWGVFTIARKRKNSFNNYYELSGLIQELMSKINTRNLVDIQIDYEDNHTQKFDQTKTMFKVWASNNQSWNLEFNEFIEQLDLNSTKISIIRITFDMGLNTNIKSYTPSQYSHKTWIEFKK